MEMIPVGEPVDDRARILLHLCRRKGISTIIPVKLVPAGFTAEAGI